ncbi:hypothetical protein BUALT_Bualt11G0092100 [Buddleja alternifolia]|uniref:TF-B3 domain-containing protein n=1 Tax=Buddleja alternifolia TaxID=168488 RepID=A0AAV6X4C5_9LAMI|nr:hypothetical protein BUALT_Bualt11G0092100 [Buddleja alternifolia]
MICAEELLDEQEIRDQFTQDQEHAEIPKLPLFEKPLTPSDVGKLNRLVIPKQHAEKHFPLHGGAAAENYLLLGFEDEIGKSWRFRYSYWNSSQSYVLTRGWSRFVKEKRLDAGDIVVFGRHRLDCGRLFIGWRRRNVSSDGGAQPPPVGGGGWSRMFYPYPSGSSSSDLPYQAAGSAVVSENLSTAAGNGNFKSVRLFGVNLECQIDGSEPSTPEGSPMSSHGQPHLHPSNQYYSNHYMDINFSGSPEEDVYRPG